MTQTSRPAEAEVPEEQLNRAIEELRGVLHKDDPQASPARPGQAGVEAGGSVATGSAGVLAHAAGSANASIIMNIPVEVQIVLGSAEMPVSELMALQKGSTVALDRRIGEPVDVMVNGRRIARGEITVLENDPSRFGIKLTEIISATKS